MFWIEFFTGIITGLIIGVIAILYFFIGNGKWLGK